DDKAEQVEMQGPAACHRIIGGSAERVGKMDVECAEEIVDVRREADGDGHVGNSVFEDEIPTDDPSDEFAKSGVSVGVSAAGDGNHGGELGVTQPGKPANYCNREKRNGDARPGAGSAVHAHGVRAMHKHAEERRLKDGRVAHSLARRSGSCGNENSAADDGADAESSEAEPAESFFQALGRLVSVRDELVDALGAEELGIHLG